jgi:3-methyladenine DNA glycosylase AlkD
LKARVDSPKTVAVSHRAALAALMALEDQVAAKASAGFFKTGKGQYAEGDRFLGIATADLRRLAKEFGALALADCERLLQSPYNEARALALMILEAHHQKGDDKTKDRVVRLYLKDRHRVNNWNLVDGSASYILGAHLLTRKRSILYKLAASRSLWDRRIAVVATLAFIRNSEFDDTLKLTAALLNDKHDLMHKACGWMLREVGKRDESVLEAFLRQHSHEMPRTMLRYAIERFTPEKRAFFLGFGRTRPKRPAIRWAP